VFSQLAKAQNYLIELLPQRPQTVDEFVSTGASCAGHLYYTEPRTSALPISVDGFVSLIATSALDARQ
jgi:hypothetical protein